MGKQSGFVVLNLFSSREGRSKTALQKGIAHFAQSLFL